MSGTQIDPETVLVVKLKAAEWQSVLAIMAESPLPHRITNPLLVEIQKQCTNQPEQPAAQPSNLRVFTPDAG